MKPTLTLRMEKPVYGGDCLARVADGKAGKTVFVPLTLPGETVSVRLTEEKRSFAKAEVEQVLAASPSRVEPLCAHFGSCGGCHYQHAEYETQLAMKQQILRETLSRAGVVVSDEIALLAGPAKPIGWRYRNRIRLAVTPEGRIGYRSRRSHEIVAIRECPIAAPILIQTALQVAERLRRNPPPVPILEMELFTDPAESQLLLTLFVRELGSAIPSWVSDLQAALPAPRPGIWLRMQDNAPDPNTAPNLEAALPPHSLSYPAAGFSYQVEHGAFFQVNRLLVDDFVALVVEGARGGVAWDLYCGVGLFARRLAASFAEVVAVEWSSASMNALRENVAGVNARVIRSTTLDFLRRNREEREGRPDFIVLDPPRAGLGEETTRLLNAIGVPEMVYVSCDPATLARDLHALTQERYRIERITLVDMFPQTFHIETVVHLVRS